jgi:methylene-fatty-acyl-phospholipid synthase
VRWTQGFPFSLFKHPQYVGTVLSIWGFFLVARYPQDDWWLLPALETIYYGIGAVLEDAPHRRPLEEV